MTPTRKQFPMPTGSVFFHVLTYLNMGYRMNRIPFLAINIGLAGVFAIMVMPFMPDNFQEAPEQVLQNLTLTQRMFLEFYNIALIPAFYKRMKDVDWDRWKLEVVMAAIYAPSLVRVFGSVELQKTLLLPLGIAGTVVLATTIYLCIAAGSEGDNRYGPQPQKK